MTDGEYRETHPHISFEFKLGDLGRKHRELLVQAYCMCEELKRYLPSVSPEAYRDLMHTYISRGIRATTAIEGSTLTLEEVEQLVSEEPPDTSEEFEELPNELEENRQMVRNMLDVYEQIRRESSELSIGRILEINRLVLQDLKVDKNTVPGEVRAHSVLVGGDKPPPAEDCRMLLKRLLEWLNCDIFAAHPDLIHNFQRIIVKAILAHLYVLYIHPFGDGNGRTARAIEVQVLVEGGIPGPATQLLSNHYNRTRRTYYEQLQRSRRSRDKETPRPDDFILYALEGFVEGLEEQVELVAQDQTRLNRQRNWELLVQKSHSHSMSLPIRRQQKVALKLPLDRPTSISEIRFLTPTIARMYGPLTDKTVSRDVGALLKKGLIIMADSGIQPDAELLENNIGI